VISDIKTIKMNPYTIPKVIAEIGCNHKGDFTIAKELIKLAQECKVDYAKFQKRNPKELLTEEQYAAPHQVPYNSYGHSYGAHREFLELDIDQHHKLKSYAESIGIGYACSVWDMTSAQEIVSLSPDFIKVPSACNNHIEMLTYLRDKYDGEIHISLGMTNHEEEAVILDLYKGYENRVVLYSCTSGYPVPFGDVCLLEINRLKESYGKRIAAVGFSGHHLGIAVDIAAYTLGAAWIERHFTKDRTWKGTDHAASLEAAGMSKLVRDLQATNAALQYKSTEVLSIEAEQRDKLKFRK
jgi:N-acetylneuraminate synthase